MPCDFRLATVEDAQTMLDIYAPYILSTCVSFEYEVPTVDQFAGRVEQTLRRFPWIVSLTDDSLSGYAYASSHKSRAAYQWSVDLSIYVSPRFQRRGIATALYDRLIAILRLQGFYGAIAGVSLPNPQSQAFHLAYGFNLVGVFHNVGYKLGAWRDVARYEFNIDTRPETPVPPLNLADLFDTPEYKSIMSHGVS